MEEHISLTRQAGGAQEQSGHHPSGTHVSGGSSEAPGAPLGSAFTHHLQAESAW